MVEGVIEGGSSVSSISGTCSISWSSGSGVGPDVDIDPEPEVKSEDGLRTSIDVEGFDDEAFLLLAAFFSVSSCSQGEGNALLICYVTRAANQQLSISVLLPSCHRGPPRPELTPEENPSLISSLVILLPCSFSSFPTNPLNSSFLSPSSSSCFVISLTSTSLHASSSGSDSDLEARVSLAEA